MSDEVIAELWRIKDDMAREYRYDVARLAAAPKSNKAEKNAASSTCTRCARPAKRSLPARSRLSTSQTRTESNSGGAQGSDTLFRATHPNHRGRDAAVILLRDAPKTVRGHDFVFYQPSMTESPRG